MGNYFLVVAIGVVGLNASQLDEVGIKDGVLFSGHVGEMGLESVGGATFDAPLGTVEHGDMVHAADMVEIQAIQQIQELTVFFIIQFSLSLKEMIACFPCMLVDGIIQLLPIEHVA